MRQLILLIAITAASFLVSGCPIEKEYYCENFTGTVSLLDDADSLLYSVVVRHQIIDFDDDTIYTYQINCDSNGYFDIYVGNQTFKKILYLEFSCDGYADQVYPASTASCEIGNIILVPDLARNKKDGE